VQKDALLGKTIAHYKILEYLGGGGMGIVYKAEDTKLKRTVALKFLPTELTRDPDIKERFMHEAQAASALDHPRIGTIYQIDEADDGQMFIAMAYYEGDTVKKKIERGLSMLDAVHIAIQVADGLAKTHQQGIVHRDIKPANIIITRDGFVKIVDFGLAKLSGGTKITKTGTTMGTPAYMSPEQVKGLQIDHRTDIWSLGVILYEMLTGALPFKGDNEMSVLYNIVNQEPVPPSQLNPKLPAALEEIVKRAMAKEVAERYSNMLDMVGKLKRVQPQLAKTSADDATVLLEEAPSFQPSKEIGKATKKTVLYDKTRLTGSLKAKKSVQKPKPKKRRSGKKSIIAILALVLIAAGVGFYYFNNRFTPQYGYLMIASEPAGAEVFLNDETTGKSTPALLGPLEKGSYPVSLSLAGYEAWSKTFTITSADTLSNVAALVALKQPTGQLSVTSDPAGAEISIDDTETGQTTPARLENLAAGEHRLLIQKAGFEPAEQSVSIEVDKTAEIAFTLQTAARTQMNDQPKSPAKRFGTLFVESTPKGAAIFLNGDPTQHKAPHTFENLKPGAYQVRLVLAGFVDNTQQVNVKPDDEQKLYVQLKEEPLATVNVLAYILENNSETVGVADIFINNRPAGQTPKKLELKSGTYKISAKMFGHTLQGGEQEITLRGGQKQTLKFKFSKN